MLFSMIMRKLVKKAQKKNGALKSKMLKYVRYSKGNNQFLICVECRISIYFTHLLIMN